MSESDISDLLERADQIEAWVRSVRQHAYHMAMDGHPPRGFKLVQKRPVRKWQDTKGVQLFMKKRGFEEPDIYKMDLKSPAQLEKLLSKDDKEFLDTFVLKESSGYTLVSESDRRAAVTPNVTDDFN